MRWINQFTASCDEQKEESTFGLQFFPELGANSRKFFFHFSTCTWQEYRQPTFHSKETPALAIYPPRRTLSSRPCYDGGDEEGEGANIGAQLRNPRQRKALRNDWWEEQVLEFSTLVKILPNHGDNLVVR